MLIKASIPVIEDECERILTKTKSKSYLYRILDEHPIVDKLLFLCKSEYSVDNNIYLSYEDIQDLEVIKNISNYSI